MRHAYESAEAIPAAAGSGDGASIITVKEAGPSSYLDAERLAFLGIRHAHQDRAWRHPDAFERVAA